MAKNVLEVPVLRVRQPIGEFYVASIPARDLVAISYSDVRRLAEDQRDLERYLGIQRPVSPKRIQELKRYVTARDATFPTAVIIAVDEKCAEFQANGPDFGQLTLHPFVPDKGSAEASIPLSRIAKVIDGQHRIAAFLQDGNNWEFEYDQTEPFDINVSIFIGADVAEQANIFATVNLAQTKVNKSLVYDLTELAHTPSPYKTCHNVAVALDRETSSPLYHRIKRLGTATPGRSKEPLTQASFVESLVKFISLDPAQDRNDLLEKKRIRLAPTEVLRHVPFRNLFLTQSEVDIVEILYNYFSAVRNKWPNSWDAVDRTGNLLPRSNAFKALMVYLREDVYPDLVGPHYGRIPAVEEFATAFANIRIRDADFTSRNFVPGSGGQSTFLKILRRQLSLEDLLE